jgi:hypothetical protein
MPRTSEQQAADDALTAAIDAALAAYADDTTPYVLTEYVIVTSQQRFDEHGEPVTAVGAIYRDGAVPTHRALGLLDYAVTQLRHGIAHGDD